MWLPLLLKITLAPALVATATWVSRRVGHGAAGMVSGLPVVAAPIVLVFSVEDGNRFAQGAAAGAVLGIASLVAFCVVYALMASRRGTLVALLAGWGAFALGTLMLSAVRPPLGMSVLFTLLAIAAGVAILRGRASAVEPGARRSDLLPWRLLITVVMVLALTAAAQGLSPHLAGLLTPFPIITAVMAGFTHSRSGASAASAMLFGLTFALLSFLTFFATLGALLGHAAPVVAYGCAVGGMFAAWALLAWFASSGGLRLVEAVAPTPDLQAR